MDAAGSCDISNLIASGMTCCCGRALTGRHAQALVKTRNSRPFFRHAERVLRTRGWRSGSVLAVMSQKSAWGRRWGIGWKMGRVARQDGTSKKSNRRSSTRFLLLCVCVLIFTDIHLLSVPHAGPLTRTHNSVFLHSSCHQRCGSGSRLQTGCAALHLPDIKLKSHLICFNSR